MSNDEEEKIESNQDTSSLWAPDLYVRMEEVSLSVGKNGQSSENQ